MLVKSARFVTSGGRPAEFPADGWPQFAFAGRSNVGKSSLINCLARQRRLVQISRTPGRTRRINFFAINEALYFVDLPGYGFASVPAREQRRWQPMIESYLRSNPCLRRVFVLLDARREVSLLDRQLIEFLAAESIPWQAVATKIDKLSANERGPRLAAICDALETREGELIPFSAKTAEGREALLTSIARA